MTTWSKRGKSLRYYGRYRRYRSYYRATTQRDQVRSRYGGLDEDVRKMFFGLKGLTLKLVLNQYEKEHGPGARQYAERTIAKWKSGDVQMSGAVSERLLAIVPVFLDFDQKYELLEKLWKHCKRPHKLSVELSPDSDAGAAAELILDGAEKFESQDLPKSVVERLSWLSHSDSEAADQLLRAVLRSEAEQAATLLTQELEMLLATARASGHRFRATTTVRIPTAHIQVTIDRTAPTIQARLQMNDTGPDSTPDERESAKDLVRRENTDASLAPIEDPRNLLDEALKRMPAKQQEKLMAKAADEALRLQVKQREGQIDQEQSRDKAEQISDHARVLGSSGAKFRIESEHKSEHGGTRITVESHRRVGMPGQSGCFIATACFDDPSNPTVVALQSFRDECLVKRPAGRLFIATYYRYSPAIARRIARMPATRAGLRVVLAFLAARLSSRYQPGAPAPRAPRR